MARYSLFLGRRVEVHYRAGDILLPASGTFVADSGRSIFLEQHLIQRGQQKNFRWEIPYQYIVRLEEAKEPPVAETKSETPIPGTVNRAMTGGVNPNAVHSASASEPLRPTGDTPAPILPLGRPPKPA
jgi:hypothetical protein